MAEMRQQADDSFPDNTTGQISAADVREWAQDLVDTVSPGYGILSLDTPPATQDFSTTTRIVTAYDTVVLATEPYTADATTGVVTVTDSVVADMQFSSSLSFPGAREALFTIYKSGVATPFSTKRDGEGATSPVTVSVGGIIEVTAGDTLDVRVTIDDTLETTLTFDTLVFIVRAVPLRD